MSPRAAASLDLDSHYTEVTRNMVHTGVREIPARYRYSILRWECKHCDFALTPDRSKGNLGRVSHGRSEMRKHVLAVHSAKAGSR